MNPPRLGLLAVLLGAAVSLAAAPASPNVLLIIADDLGWSDVSWRGSPARTPNLDQLRRDGVELLRYYANPLCSPTRAALQTGRSAVQQGIRDIFTPRDDGLSLLEHLMPQSFRAAGYQTALTGKWHLGATAPERQPNARGFDHFYGFLGAAISYYTHLGENTTRVDWQRDGQTLNETGYATDLLTDEAVRLLRGRDRNRPFFHVVAYNAPHTPFEAPDDLKRHYPALSGDAQTFAAMVESLDLGIGRLLAELAAQGIAGDTLVVFVSDNGGPAPGGAHNTPLRSVKGTVYEGGIRVPAILSWPGVIRAGVVSEQFLTPQDLFPTVAAATGVTARNGLPFDGLNLWELLRSGGAPVERSFSVASPSSYAQFEGRWKLVRGGARDELYDVVADPTEAVNLAASQPAVLARLQGALDASLRRALGAEPAGDARITNLSARAAAGGAAGTPILGFVVAGGDQRVLVRGVGPALAGFGVTGALTDPLLELRRDATLVQANDNWSAADAPLMAASGAFALPADSRDAALVAILPPGAYTAQTRPADGGQGVALVEIYDVGGGSAGARLVNASTRALVGTGSAILIPGIVVGGSGAAGLLVRAVGPGLTRFGVGDALADPVLALYRGSSLIAGNDDWGQAANAAQVAATAAASGAFPLDPGSRDAALLTTLPAGQGYSVQVSGRNNTTGTVLVEFYVLR